MPCWLITTDIAHPRRLRKAARVCERVARRIQESVYFAELDHEALYSLQAALAAIIRGDEDTVRYYPLCSRDLQRSFTAGLCPVPGLSPGHWLI